MRMPLIAAASLTAASLFFAPMASASPNDDAFLNDMHSHNIQNQQGDAAMVKFAQEVCTVLKSGTTEQQLIDELVPTVKNGITADDVKFIVQDSEKYYCPGAGKGGTTV